MFDLMEKIINPQHTVNKVTMNVVRTIENCHGINKYMKIMLCHSYIKANFIRQLVEQNPSNDTPVYWRSTHRIIFQQKHHFRPHNWFASKGKLLFRTKNPTPPYPLNRSKKDLSKRWNVTNAIFNQDLTLPYLVTRWKRSRLTIKHQILTKIWSRVSSHQPFLYVMA
jgi:hypothetical protein